MGPFNHTVACFIERNRHVKGLDKYFIGQWLQARNANNHAFTRYEDYITIEMVLASNAEQQTWAAIEQSDHIWCNTAFIGESAVLFGKMVRLAVAQGIHDKYFFNLEERSFALYQLAGVDPSVLSAIKYLEKNCGIRFFFWEEIWGEIQHRSKILRATEKGTQICNC